MSWCVELSVRQPLILHEYESSLVEKLIVPLPLVTGPCVTGWHPSLIESLATKENLAVFVSPMIRDAVNVELPGFAGGPE